MNTSNQKISDDATVALSTFHRIMRSKGYKMLAITQSAITEFRYSKTDPLHEYVASISAHHGRGKWGPGKTILAFCVGHNQFYQMDMVCRRNDPNSPVDWKTGEYTEAGVKLHTKLITDITNYLQLL